MVADTVPFLSKIVGSMTATIAKTTHRNLSETDLATRNLAKTRAIRLGTTDTAFLNAMIAISKIKKTLKPRANPNEATAVNRHKHITSTVISNMDTGLTIPPTKPSGSAPRQIISSANTLLLKLITTISGAKNE